MSEVVSKDQISKIFNDVDDFYILRALGCSSFEPLSLKQFIAVSKFEVDKYMVDKFFHSLKRRYDVYINLTKLNYFGYVGEHKTKKAHFKELLNSGRFKKGVDYWDMSTAEYTEYYKKVIQPMLAKAICDDSATLDGEQKQSYFADFPHPDEFTGRGKSITKHLILTSDCFKQVMMMLNTKKGGEVGRFYLMLERLVMTYAEYQVVFQANRSSMLLAANSELNRKVDKLLEGIDDLKLQNEELKEDIAVSLEHIVKIEKKINIATDDLALRPDDKRSLNQPLIMKLNDPDCEWNYKIARVQKASVNKTIKSIKVAHKKAAQLMLLHYLPNGMTFCKVMKERMNGLIRTSGCKIQLLPGCTEEQFVNEVIFLDKSKKEIESDEEEF